MAATINVVPGPGTPIQAGIDAAAAGDTVSVAAGTYTGNLIINKANLTLVAIDGPATTTITSVYIAPCPTCLPTSTIHIFANGVTVDGFTVDGLVPDTRPDRAFGTSLQKSRTQIAIVPARALPSPLMTQPLREDRVPRPTRRPAKARAAAIAGAVALSVFVGACSSSTNTTGGSGGSGTAKSSATINPVDQAELESTVAELAREMMVPGAVVLLRTSDGTATVTYGTQTLNGSTPVSLDDHIRVGSNTKTFTTTAILQLVQEGKVRLDDTVSEYREGVPNGATITIAELLEMRSGLFNYSQTIELNQTLDDDPTKAWTPDELLALSFAHPVNFAPGEEYEYSNTNTVLLGLIAEQVDGKPLAQIFQDRFFGPLGMRQTVFPDVTSNATPDPHPQGYMFGTNVETMEELSPERQAAAVAGTFLPSDVTDENPSWGWSAGAAISTAGDLATWAEAMGAGKVLNARMQAKRMASLRETVPGNPAAPSYGYGIALMGPFYGHTGELPGFNSFMGYDPQQKVTLIVWTNLNATTEGKGPAVELAKAIIGMLYGTTAGAGSPSDSG